MGVMKQSWKALNNGSLFTVPVNTNPGGGGLWRFALVISNHRTDVVRYELYNGDYRAMVLHNLAAADNAAELTPSYDGETLTLDYSKSQAGGIRVLLLD